MWPVYKKSAPKKTRSPKRDKFQDLFAATLKLLGTRDLSELSLTELARESGVSKSLILYHYPSLKKIFLEIFVRLSHEALQRTTSWMDKAKDPLAKIKAMSESTFDWIRQSPHEARFFLLMHHQASVDAEYTGIQKEILQRGLDRIELLLFQMGKIKDPEDVKLRALMIHNLMIGATIRMGSMNDAKHLDAHLKKLLRGIEFLCESEKKS